MEKVSFRQASKNAISSISESSIDGYAGVSIGNCAGQPEWSGNGCFGSNCGSSCFGLVCYG